MVRPVSRKINKLVNLEGTFFFAKLIKSKPFRSIDPFTDRYIYIYIGISLILIWTSGYLFLRKVEIFCTDK